MNRPAPDPHGLIGGPSLAVAPNAEVLLETADPMSFVTLRRDVVRSAKGEYPGYLETFPGLYAEGWERLKGGREG